ncbi:F-box/kelch-repeat protein [Raphanus sativus]|nr:F-box/kelch-repeat protein [Raphanus sativus]
MAKEEQSSEPPSLIKSLPQDLIVEVLSRISRFEYPTLSLVCKHFQSIVTSPGIFSRRSLLGRTEHCLYVVLCCQKNRNHKRIYILRKKKTNGDSPFVTTRILGVRPICFILIKTHSFLFLSHIGSLSFIPHFPSPI